MVSKMPTKVLLGGLCAKVMVWDPFPAHQNAKHSNCELCFIWLGIANAGNNGKNESVWYFGSSLNPFKSHPQPQETAMIDHTTIQIGSQAVSIICWESVKNTNRLAENIKIGNSCGWNILRLKTLSSDKLEIQAYSGWKLYGWEKLLVGAFLVGNIMIGTPLGCQLLRCSNQLVTEVEGNPTMLLLVACLRTLSFSIV